MVNKHLFFLTKGDQKRKPKVQNKLVLRGETGKKDKKNLAKNLIKGLI